jgi:hypothetical protein
MTSMRSSTALAIIADPKCSLKRLAWAYGCSRKGSDEEREPLAILLKRAREQG